MARPDRAVLQRIDGSLLVLRRLVDAPRSIPGTPGAPGHLDVSTVLVVDAVERIGRTGRPSVAAVARRLDVAPSTASRLVSRAESAGMVVRAPDPFNRRRRCLTLTARGRALQRRAVHFRVGRLAGALGSWSDDDLAQFDRLLDRFAADTRSLAAGHADLEGYADADRHRGDGRSRR